MISVHSLLHYLVTFSLSKMDLTCPTKKTNGSLYAMFSCSAGLELPQDFVWMYSRWSLRPTPLHTLCTTHAKHALPELVGRRLGLLLSSEATMLLALLGLGATLSREDYRRRARKGYLMQHKFHLVCSRLPP